MDYINQDGLIPITTYIEDEDKINLIAASKNLSNIYSTSSKLLREFTLSVDLNNLQLIYNYENFFNMPLKNMSVNFTNFTNLNQITTFVRRYHCSLETLNLNNVSFKNFKECFEFLNGMKNLKSLNLVNCRVENLYHETLAPIETLKSISFTKCNDNIFKIFTKQNTLEKITIANDEWTWNGFPHDVFNEICKNSKNLYHLVLNGAGTGSYFDSDEFPYTIKILETTMVSFHWYVGLKSARVNFLESQKGSLKDLTIHELPYDFDGGKVLKYIIEEMDLETFYYGNIPLILNGQKQEVKEFMASEIQITSAFEMFKQFPCYKFTLRLTRNDIASDEIERIINLQKYLFKNLKEFELIDDSAYRGLFGVFLGLFKKFINIQQLSFKTMDRNINVILEQCLPEMINLKDIYLTSTAPRLKERLNTIKKYAPNLKILSIAKKFANEAEEIFEGKVEIREIE